ncbi:MAG: DNA alkylation repair protein, partial [Erysipelotrichaceae bacterium]|nr:DNA alkylation repair protein [Erysipelotrichaceae bacterium]
MTELQTLLFSLQDLTYKQFMMPLLPNVDPDSIIGIRTPVLRTIAKEYKEEAFLQQLPHTFFEENQIHAFRINRIKDFDIMMEYLEAFLPFV